MYDPTFFFFSGACQAGTGRPGTLCIGAAGRVAAVCCVRVGRGVSRGKLLLYDRFFTLQEVPRKGESDTHTRDIYVARSDISRSICIFVYQASYIGDMSMSMSNRGSSVAQLWATSVGKVRLRALPSFYCSGVSASV